MKRIFLFLLLFIFWHSTADASVFYHRPRWSDISATSVVDNPPANSSDTIVDGSPNATAFCLAATGGPAGSFSQELNYGESVTWVAGTTWHVQDSPPYYTLLDLTCDDAPSPPGEAINRGNLFRYYDGVQGFDISNLDI
jgi:hypothetical protein